MVDKLKLSEPKNIEEMNIEECWKVICDSDWSDDSKSRALARLLDLGCSITFDCSLT